MKLPVRFYIGYILTLVVIIGLVEMTFGTLYARYVILYTGGIFMGGLLVGQRYEQAWLARRSRSRRPSASIETGSPS
ncbi:MAG: hypothetical protein AB1515_08960 [Nitrospirota bacterium]